MKGSKMFDSEEFEDEDDEPGFEDDEEDEDEKSIDSTIYVDFIFGNCPTKIYCKRNCG